MRNHAARSTAADRYQGIPGWQAPRDHRSGACTCTRLSQRAEIEELLTLGRQAALRVPRGENPKQDARTDPCIGTPIAKGASSAIRQRSI